MKIFSLIRVRANVALRVLPILLLASLVSAQAPEVSSLTKLSEGFKFTEGPVGDAEGNVYFSDIPNNRIHKWSADGKLTTFRENSGGANGLALDAKGNLIACEGGARRVTSTDMKGNVSVLVESYEGKKLNSPNDLWIDKKGGFYFTDPRYGPTDDLEQDGMHVYYLPPSGGKSIRVANDFVRPNGIVGTTDGKTLYIADEGGNKTYRYSIRPDATLADKKLFTEQGSDGMTLDDRGNVYLTGDGVTVYDPSGKEIMKIKVPLGPANVAFVGKDRKTLFITAQTAIFSAQLNVAGW